MQNGALAYVVEFGALAAIAVLLLAFWEKASAQKYAGQASSAGPVAWAALELNAGNSVINALSNWGPLRVNPRGPARQPVTGS